MFPKPARRQPKARKPIRRVALKRSMAARRVIRILKVKQPSRTILKRRADILFSQYIRRRDGKCQRCGSMERLQCAHIVSRAYLTIRWDPRNAMALCAGCHMYFTHHPIEWEMWVDDKFGEEYLLGLKREVRTAIQGAKTVIDYQKTIDTLNSLTNLLA